MNTANNRNICKEQFYTNELIAKEAIDKLKETNLWQQIELVIEPSCGKGAFVDPIKEKDVIGFDIEPKIIGDNIYKQDFLDVDISKYTTQPRDRILCLGNPPFGRRQTLVKKFINKCAGFCDNIIMIVPIAIPLGQTGLSALNRFLHIKTWERLPVKNIWVDSNGQTVKRAIKTALVHFERRDYPREKIIRITGGKGWQFVNRKVEIHSTDVAVFRFSAKAFHASSDVKRSANHILRFERNLTNSDLNKLKDTLLEWFKGARNDTTTGMVNLTQVQLSKKINELMCF